MRATTGMHETERDKANERRIISQFAGYFSSEYVFLTSGYHVDSMLIRKDSKVRQFAFAEARRRFNSIEKYPTLSLSLQKYFSLMDHSRFAPTFYVVEWDEGMYYYRITDVALPINYMSRSSGDPRDNEPCVEIPIGEFRQFWVPVAQE